MQKRFLPFIMTIGASLAIAILIWGFLPPETEASSLENSLVGQTTFVPVTGAGTVILLRSGDELEIKSAIPFNGYSYDIEIGKGRLVRALFRGENRQVLFTAILDNGEVRATSTVLETDPGEFAVESTTTSAATTVIVAPATTIAPVLTTTAPASPPTTKAPPATTTTVAPTTTALPSTTATTVRPTTTTTIPPTTTTTIAPTTTTAVPGIPDGVVTYSLGQAGTITVTFLKQKFVDGVVNAASGWSVDKADGDSNNIRIELVNGDLRTIWEARIRGGRVIIDLRTDED